MIRFIPKFKDGSLLNTTIDEFIVGADIVVGNEKSFNNIANQITDYTIDPVTNRLPFKSTTWLEKLPYFVDKTELNSILSNSSERLHKLIVPCVEFQIEKKSKRIIPPYFHVEDVTSQTFNINIENISTVIKYKEKNKLDFDIYPVINITANILNDDNLIRFIASLYLSDVIIDHIKGFYLQIEGLHGNTSESPELIGLLKLVKALSQKEVHILNINSFGYLTFLVGAISISSGLASSENVSVESWKDGGNARPRPWKFIYVPEIFGYVDEIELQKMNYTCSCEYCNGSLPKTVEDKKRHFLSCKQRDVNSISQTNPSLRVEFIKRMLGEARDKANSMINNRQTSKTASFLVSPITKWIGILDVIDEINKQEEAQDLLNKILNDIDSNDD